MASIYSHSRLSSFENCPKQFHFRYVIKVASDTESIEAFLGKRVHEVLEKLYGVARDGRVPTVDQVVRRFHSNWDEAFDADRIRIVRDELTPDFYRSIGERCLRGYYRRHYPFDGDETLGLEERVTFALDPEGEYRMQGVVDRIARARDGAIEIHDFKTGQRVPPQRVLDEDRQLALYQLGLAERFGDAPEIRLVWHYLAADQLRVSHRSTEQLETLRSRTIELIDRVRTEMRFEPRTSALCGWCEYRDRCPAIVGEEAADARAREIARLAAPRSRPSPRAPAPPAVRSCRCSGAGASLAGWPSGSNAFRPCATTTPT